MSKKINRENLLNDLNMVKAGLSPREYIEQSSCFVFEDGWVMTFNDEVACQLEVDLDVVGAVQATNLLAILEKIPDEDLTVEENNNNELEFQGKGKRFGLTKEAEIHLPIDKVERPKEWKKLPKEFTEAIGLVQHCVSTDESKFVLTCVHIAPDYIEACDNLQAMRCRLKTGLQDSVLVRGKSLAHITTLGMDEVSVTKSWLHFRNQAGLIFSCRLYNEPYHSLDPILKFKGSDIVIPKGVADASERAAVFASDKSGDPLVTVNLSGERILITGKGISGWYKEVRRVDYEGPPMEFLISPLLLKHVSEKYSDAQITSSKLKVSGGSWEYVTVLGQETAKDEEAEGDRDAQD